MSETHSVLKIINDNDGALGLTQLNLALGGDYLSTVKELLAKGLIREANIGHCRYRYFVSQRGRIELGIYNPP